VSSENTERQLVGFVASRTRVRDPFLGSANITALLLTFSGRTSVPLPGAVASADAARNTDLARLLYQDEDTLYRDCRRLGVAYVLYSIDYLLDTSRYSPSYLAGVSRLSSDSAAFRMHFAPEALRHFTLVYENEHYRLYRVTDEPGTLFLTDHPPVYQRDAFDRVGADRDAFRQRVLDLLLAYRQGMRARERGDIGRALEHFRWCLEQAPGYTQARIAVGTTLITARRYEDAREVLMSVIGYAPDNPLALYYTAYVHAAMGETDRAREFLDLFFTAATDPDLIERARLLKTMIDQGLPVTPRSTPE
jgi:tetratricopeptide (TPR) repeat protein